MKINTKQVLQTLEKKAIKANGEDLTVGVAISEILFQNRAEGKYKMYVLAKNFYEQIELEIDQADRALVKNAIEHTEMFNNLVLGQLIEILDSAE